jgi:hypothetical protein
LNEREARKMAHPAHQHSTQKRLDEFEGQIAALATLVLAVIEALPAEMQANVWQQFAVGAEAVKATMLQGTWTDDAIRGFDIEVGGINASRIDD